MSNTIGHPRGTTVEKFKATFKFQRLNYVPMTKSRENGSKKLSNTTVNQVLLRDLRILLIKFELTTAKTLGFLDHFLIFQSKYSADCQLLTLII